MNNLSLKQRLLFAVLAVGALCLLLGFVYVQWLRVTLVNEVIEERRDHLVTILQERIKSKEEFGIGVSVMLAQHCTLRQAVLTDDRPLATTTLNRILETYATTTNYRGLRVQIHTDRGLSWLRSWAPDQFGDDVSFRASIQRMLQERSPAVAQDEMGRQGLAIRGLAPIIDDGRYLGSLELLQGVGSISRDFERDGAAYLLLLSQDALADSPGVRDNRRIGDYIVANDRWFNDHALNFGRSLNFKQLVEQGTELGAEWFAAAVPLVNARGATMGLHLVGVPAQEVRAEIANATRFAWLFLALIAVLVVLMGLLIAWLVQRSMITPIKHNIARIAEMENNREQRLTVERQDELGVLFQAVNHYADYLQQVLQQIADTAHQLATTAQQLLGEAHKGLDLVNRQQNETQQVASASVEMAASAEEMSGSAKQTQDSAEQALGSAKQGSGVVSETRGAIGSLAANMRTMLHSIQLLDQRSQRIGSVLQTITDISEQTNLLALNAAIEAARAGEHGRSFAVVADEVRSLANKTKTSTSEIDQIIHELQSAVGEVTTAIGQGQDQTERCVNFAQQASEQLDFIQQTVSDVHQQGTHINQAANEQRNVAEEVSQNIVQVNALSDHSGQLAREILAIAESLNQRAKELETLLV